jgi:hypothetical protein
MKSVDRNQLYLEWNQLSSMSSKPSIDSTSASPNPTNHTHRAFSTTHDPRTGGNRCGPAGLCCEGSQLDAIGIPLPTTAIDSRRTRNRTRRCLLATHGGRAEFSATATDWGMCRRRRYLRDLSRITIWGPWEHGHHLGTMKSRPPFGDDEITATIWGAWGHAPHLEPTGRATKPLTPSKSPTRAGWPRIWPNSAWPGDVKAVAASGEHGRNHHLGPVKSRPPSAEDEITATIWG